MYQCRAENRHGVIYANAELRVFGESKHLKVNSGAHSSQLVRLNKALNVFSDLERVSWVTHTVLR